jgi:hypothetical protein
VKVRRRPNQLVGQAETNQSEKGRKVFPGESRQSGLILRQVGCKSWACGIPVPRRPCAEAFRACGGLGLRRPGAKGGVNEV